MGMTGFDAINGYARFKPVSSLPTTPEAYYGVSSNDVVGTEWVGGESCYHRGDNRLYVQYNTSGRTAMWKRLLTQFATTTSSSTSSSSSTSTSTSTTSSSTSSSTSTSSTTTMA
jgi:hypothetical protein